MKSFAAVLVSACLFWTNVVIAGDSIADQYLQIFRSIKSTIPSFEKDPFESTAEYERRLGVAKASAKDAAQGLGSIRIEVDPKIFKIKFNPDKLTIKTTIWGSYYSSKNELTVWEDSKYFDSGAYLTEHKVSGNCKKKCLRGHFNLSIRSKDAARAILETVENQFYFDPQTVGAFIEGKTTDPFAVREKTALYPWIFDEYYIWLKDPVIKLYDRNTGEVFASE